MTKHRLNRPARGLSIVELLIGVAVGLFVLAGAAMVATDQIVDNRRLLLETQIQQDMRTAMDIIVRDIRRSGYGYYADELATVGGPPTPATAYQPAGAIGGPSDTLLYTYGEASYEDNKVVDPKDHRGFQHAGDVIQVQLGQDNWQPLTDPDVVKITTFTATPEATVTPLPTCKDGPPCTETACGVPRIVTRSIRVVIEGVARHDDRVKRRLESIVRVRNDEVCL